MHIIPLRNGRYNAISTNKTPIVDGDRSGERNNCADIVRNVRYGNELSDSIHSVAEVKINRSRVSTSSGDKIPTAK